MPPLGSIPQLETKSQTTLLGSGKRKTTLFSQGFLLLCVRPRDTPVETHIRFRALLLAKKILVVAALVLVVLAALWWARLPRPGRFQAVAGEPTLAANTKTGRLCNAYGPLGRSSPAIPPCRDIAEGKK